MAAKRPLATPRREPLNREKIAAAALDFIDRLGLEELSTRRLGKELGVEGMALYKHFASKEALLDSVTELLLRGLEVPGPQPGGWKDRARLMARQYRLLAKQHPKAYPLLVTRRFNTPHMLTLLDTVFSSLLSEGLTLAQAVELYRIVAAFSNGAVLDELVGYTLKDRAPEFPANLPSLLSATALLGESSFDPLFEAGLESILAGFEQRHRLPPRT